jgi:hypothetical protein
MPKIEILCQICHQRHKIEVEDLQLQGMASINYLCPAIDRRYRLMSFFVDTSRNLYSSKYTKQQADSHTEYLKSIFGEQDFQHKYERWIKIEYPEVGLIDEYPNKITEIINTYCSGYYYPAVTSACCLAERILNRLILKTRKYFTSHSNYKRIFRKSSFNDWDKMLEIISDWQLIPEKSIEILCEIKNIRHQSIHYNELFDFEAIVTETINKLIAAVTEIFGVLNRKDIYLVFDIPGEIWVRSIAEERPFVKEFVLPFCYYAHAVHDIDFKDRKITERLGKIGKLTDEEFVNLRKASLYDGVG